MAERPDSGGCTCSSDVTLVPFIFQHCLNLTPSNSAFNNISSADEEDAAMSSEEGSYRSQSSAESNEEHYTESDRAQMERDINNAYVWALVARYKLLDENSTARLSPAKFKQYWGSYEWLIENHDFDRPCEDNGGEVDIIFARCEHYAANLRREVSAAAGAATPDNHVYHMDIWIPTTKYSDGEVNDRPEGDLWKKDLHCKTMKVSLPMVGGVLTGAGRLVLLHLLFAGVEAVQIPPEFCRTTFDSNVMHDFRYPPRAVQVGGYDIFEAKDSNGRIFPLTMDWLENVAHFLGGDDVKKELVETLQQRRTDGDHRWEQICPGAKKDRQKSEHPTYVRAVPIPIKYHQDLKVGASTCMVDSFCSALFHMGIAEAERIHEEGKRLKPTQDLAKELAVVVNKHLKGRYKLVHDKNKRNRFDPRTQQQEFPILCKLKSSRQNGVYPHCVTFYDGYMYDSSNDYAKPINKYTLDNSIERYAGIYWAKRLVPCRKRGRA